jgi:3-phosphoglycerate kinase
MMTSERQRLPKNAAKVQFIAHLETIKSMLNEGYNLRNIHNKLCELSEFSMSYFTLCDRYRKSVREVKNKEQAKPVITPKIPSAPAVPKKLTRPEDIDRDTLF